MAAARAACAERTGVERSMTSGALHDAAEVAGVVPAAMVFCPSIGGISHAAEEDTSEADLAVGIEAFGALARVRVPQRVMTSFSSCSASASGASSQATSAG